MYKEQTKKELTDEIGAFLQHPIVRTDIRHEKVVFTPLKTWLGYDRLEKVAEWNTRVFEFSNVDLQIRKRQRNKTASPYPAAAEEIQGMARRYDDYYFSQNEEEPRGLLSPDEFLSSKLKSFKGTAWFSHDFPRTVADLLPLFEVISPAQKHFEKLNDFLKMNLPSECGFPVQIEVPIFPTVAGQVTFLQYEEEAIDEGLFVIPPDYQREAKRDIEQDTFEMSTENLAYLSNQKTHTSYPSNSQRVV